MNKKLATLTLASFLTASAVYADSSDSKVIEKSFDVSSFKMVDANVHVGSIKVRPSNNDKINLKIVIEPKDGFFNWFADSVDDIELMVQEEANTIEFELTEGEYKEKWVLEVPADLHLEVDIGVGDVKIKDIAGDIDVDNGVGNVRVEGEEKHFADVDLDAGVGDTKVSADRGKTSNKRATVASSTKWYGEGQYSIKVDVGVGNAKVVLN